MTIVVTTMATVHNAGGGGDRERIYRLTLLKEHWEVSQTRWHLSKGFLESGWIPAGRGRACEFQQQARDGEMMTLISTWSRARAKERSEAGERGLLKTS